MHVKEIQSLTRFLIDEAVNAKEMMDNAGEDSSDYDFHEGRQLQSLKTLKWVEEHISSDS
jgi:hypothetical protein